MSEFVATLLFAFLFSTFLKLVIMWWDFGLLLNCARVTFNPISVLDWPPTLFFLFLLFLLSKVESILVMGFYACTPETDLARLCFYNDWFLTFSYSLFFAWCNWEVLWSVWQSTVKLVALSERSALDFIVMFVWFIVLLSRLLLMSRRSRRIDSLRLYKKLFSAPGRVLWAVVALVLTPEFTNELAPLGMLMNWDCFRCWFWICCLNCICETFGKLISWPMTVQLLNPVILGLLSSLAEFFIDWIFWCRRTIFSSILSVFRFKCTAYLFCSLLILFKSEIYLSVVSSFLNLSISSFSAVSLIFCSSGISWSMFF